jgi:SAM-dependent methyltransferase
MSKTDAFAAKQFSDWNGPSGESWAKRQEEQDVILAPVSAILFAAAKLQPGERVLDIGCGCGDTTLEAARRVGLNGSALGVDISTPMVSRAKERAEAERLNASFIVADATSHALEPGSADVLISRFGVMFFAEPQRAFANLRTAVRPGGRVAFICWQPLALNEWFMVPLRASLKHVPRVPDPDPDEPGPFAFADERKVTRILEGAGFTDVMMRREQVKLDIAAGRGFEAGVTGACTIGPTARALREVSEEQRTAGIEEVRAALMPFSDGDRVPLTAAPWVVQARG